MHAALIASPTHKSVNKALPPAGQCHDGIKFAAPLTSTFAGWLTVVIVDSPLCLVDFILQLSTTRHDNALSNRVTLVCYPTGPLAPSLPIILFVEPRAVS